MTQTDPALKVFHENRGKLRDLLRHMPFDRWIGMVWVRTVPPLPPSGEHCTLTPVWYATHARKLVSRRSA
jgi:hypothetical protein